MNLQRLVKSHGINLAVQPSKGSIENIDAVYQRPGVQMGIVQSDVLAFVARVQSDPVLKRIARKTKMVFPLYNEEVHVLGRREMQDFDDLADRRVAIGREGSGTYLTARLLFKVSEVAPKEMVPIDTEEALAELKAGRDRRDVLRGRIPVKLFTERHRGRRTAPGPHHQQEHHRVLSAGRRFPPHLPVAIEPVNTVAVKAVLVSFDFRGRDCDTVGRFAQIVTEKHEWLIKNGHPKWKSVDFEYPLKGWEQYDCVRKYLGRPTQSAARSRAADTNPVMEAIKEMLSQ